VRGKHQNEQTWYPELERERCIFKWRKNCFRYF